MNWEMVQARARRMRNEKNEEELIDILCMRGTMLDDGDCEETIVDWAMEQLDELMEKEVV